MIIKKRPYSKSCNGAREKKLRERKNQRKYEKKERKKKRKKIKGNDLVASKIAYQTRRSTKCSRCTMAGLWRMEYTRGLRLCIPLEENHSPSLNRHKPFLSNRKRSEMIELFIYYNQKCRECQQLQAVLGKRNELRQIRSLREVFQTVYAFKYQQVDNEADISSVGPSSERMKALSSITN